MRFAYADPPYLGYSRFYPEHPEATIWDDIETHRAFIEKLQAEYPEGWALSMTTGNLRDLLPLCPAFARVAAWIKPFASFKPGVQPAYAWEPVVFVRTRKANRELPTSRDFLAEPITLRRGLTGAKPDRFNQWILDLLGYIEGEDTIDDLFPGTAGLSKTLDAPPLDFGEIA